ncbi:MAG: guanylate kinase [Lachnospiraceae bacterium]|nr:guanylate kinase [Lachnospiraceae bacterium]
MGRIYCIMGKSSTGKDTIYKKLLRKKGLQLNRIVPYTTRPIREGEEDGIEYFFTDVDILERLKQENRIIECRGYQTVHGMWYYYMVKDDQINLEDKDYLIIGTLESYVMIRDYFGEDKVCPIYIEVEDGVRLTRALFREKKQKSPKFEEMCRRFIADNQDFSEEKLRDAGIEKRFVNNKLSDCLQEVTQYISNMK